MVNPFFLYSKENDYAYLNGTIYPYENGKFNPGFDVGVFDKIYLSKFKISEACTENQKLARFVMENIIKKPFTISIENENLLKSCMPFNFLNDKGTFKKKKKSILGKIKLFGEKYSFTRNTLDMKVVELDYNLKLNTKIGKTTVLENYYDAEKNLGFELKNDDFYVYTIVEPYILYDKSTQKKYKFDEAKVGLKLELVNDEVEYGNLVVLNEYSHPALPDFDKPMQTICLGWYDPSTLKINFNLENQIVLLLKKGKKALTEEYILPNVAWHKLSEEKFERFVQ
ncbi:hypothetical protein D6777_01450 [Candidatus Woesearchaeota archaeon]|nr:MAG: hypothetical protein D6777_01450 [Candidatus Woesearchaeota archaeon]